MNLFKKKLVKTGFVVFTFLFPLFSNGHTAEALAVNQEKVSASVLVQTTAEQVAALTHHNGAVMKVYNNLMDLVLDSNQEGKEFSSDEVQQICQAVLFAADFHKLQTRQNKEKTPYICHPLQVAYDLMQIGKVRDVSVIVGAILHDTAGDKQVEIQAINKQFGSKVANLVEEVSAHPVSAQETHQRNLMIHATEQSIGTVQIELADLLYSLKELSTSPPSHWKKEKVDHFFEWAQSVVDRFPNANQPLRDAIQATIQDYWDKNQ